MTRQLKGTVSIDTNRGWLRLRFTHQGERYAFAIGLPDSPSNRKYTERIARQIELEIVSGHFDTTLTRYKPATKRAQLMPIHELFTRFMDEKAKSLYKRTLEKYACTLKNIQEFFKGKAASGIDVEAAERFSQWLAPQIAPITRKERLTQLRACWQWGIQQGWVETNPWLELPKRVKVPPKQKPKPFTREEIGAIILGFRNDAFYCHYADFVEFLLSTGCRIGEACGLQWRHVSHDFLQVWIGESLSRGTRKETKTNQARTINLTPRLSAMLRSLHGTCAPPRGGRHKSLTPDSLVFTSPRGSAIGKCQNSDFKLCLSFPEADLSLTFLSQLPMNNACNS
jgi:integrase